MTTSELKQQIEKVLGNSIRCLLPSYWWKRLFHQVVDRIDEAKEEVTNALEIPIVESVEALESLDLSMGKLAVVAVIKETEFSARDCYQATAEEINNAYDTNNFEQFTKIQKINIVGVPSVSTGVLFRDITTSEPFILDYNETEARATFFTESGPIEISLTNTDGSINQSAVQRMNSRISGKDCRYIGAPTGNNEIQDEEFDILDSFLKLATLESVSDQYIKGETSWERIAKESELTSSIIVNSIDELNALDAPQGTIASVVVHQGYGNFANCYQSSEEELTENLESGTNRINEEYLNKLTRIYGVRFELPSEPFGETIETSVVQYNQDAVSSSDRVGIMSFISDGTISGTYIKVFGSKVPVFKEDGSLNDEFFNETQLYYDYPAYHLETVGNGHLLSKVFVPIMDYSDVYVKGTTWEKLAKESDLGNKEGEENESKSIETLYYRVQNPDTTKEHNAKVFQKINTSFVRLLFNDGSANDNQILCGTYGCSYAKMEDYFLIEVFESVSNRVFKLTSDGTLTFQERISYADSSLSITSTTAVQNKVVTEALNNKVDKVEGKQLSTEDFTTALKTKLEGLRIPTKTSELTNDSGFLVEHQDISHLATKEEVTNLQNEVIANEEVVAKALVDLDTRINEIIIRLDNFEI